VRAPKQVSHAGNDQDLLGILLVLDSLGLAFIIIIIT